jgi:hypothetical protein
VQTGLPASSSALDRRASFCKLLTWIGILLPGTLYVIGIFGLFSPSAASWLMFDISTLTLVHNTDLTRPIPGLLTLLFAYQFAHRKQTTLQVLAPAPRPSAVAPCGRSPLPRTSRPLPRADERWLRIEGAWEHFGSAKSQALGGGRELHFLKIQGKAGNRHKAGLRCTIKEIKTAERASTMCFRTWFLQEKDRV